MAGVHSFDGNHPFLVLKTGFYENAFAGMLEWERYMKDDLAPLFGPAKTKIPSGQIVADTVQEPELVFVDSVIKNKDTRILRGKNGKTELLYSFVDKNTIIITTNEHTLEEVFVRHTTSKTR